MTAMQLSEGITLMSGARFDYHNPSVGSVELNDLIQPLSNICRFAGQLPYFYSVAQHLVNTSLIVPPEFAFEALMHDTAEAFTNDVPTPLKVQVPMFKEIEVKVESDMARRFGFAYPFSKEVMLADRQMLGLEMYLIRGQDPGDHAILDGIEFAHLAELVDLTSWSPRLAKRNWLARYEDLTS